MKTGDGTEIVNHYLRNFYLHRTKRNVMYSYDQMYILNDEDQNLNQIQSSGRAAPKVEKYEFEQH